ncbi:hypothetical protein Hanom_Chr07g00627481 [Helianthus anomalus]
MEELEVELEFSKDLRKCFHALKTEVGSRDDVFEALRLLPPTVVHDLALLNNSENGTKDVQLMSQMLELFKQGNESMELKRRFLLSL